MKRLAPGILVLMIGHAWDAGAAAVASGRNWRISIDSVGCEAAESLVTIGMQIRYLGPKGPVEAPVTQLVDGKGKPHLPKSLVWEGGGKPLAELLAAGGLRNIQSEHASAIQLKFELRGATGDLSLEFGDIKAFRLTRKRASACEGLLKPDRVQAPRAARADSAKSAIRVHRDAYPCIPSKPGAPQIAKAQYPPYLPRQLLLFGRGYLPNARQIDLPMGRAPAQSYAYAGADDVVSIEDAARRAARADFPEYGEKHFAFNWGTQKSASGNDVYSVGIYDLRPCPR